MHACDIEILQCAQGSCNASGVFTSHMITSGSRGNGSSRAGEGHARSAEQQQGELCTPAAALQCLWLVRWRELA